MVSIIVPSIALNSPHFLSPLPVWHALLSTSFYQSLFGRESGKEGPHRQGRWYTPHAVLPSKKHRSTIPRPGHDHASNLRAVCNACSDPCTSALIITGSSNSSLPSSASPLKMDSMSLFNPPCTLGNGKIKRWLEHVMLLFNRYK